MLAVPSIIDAMSQGLTIQDWLTPVALVVVKALGRFLLKVISVIVDLWRISLLANNQCYCYCWSELLLIDLCLPAKEQLDKHPYGTIATGTRSFRIKCHLHLWDVIMKKQAATISESFHQLQLLGEKNTFLGSNLKHVLVTQCLILALTTHRAQQLWTYIAPLRGDGYGCSPIHAQNMCNTSEDFFVAGTSYDVHIYQSSTLYNPIH